MNVAAFTEDDVPRISPMFRFQWEEAQDCHVLLYPEGMVRLSSSAGEILKRCDGDASVAAIIAGLNEQYPDADLENDVLKFIEEAVNHGWIKI